jgi:hypothetical protein
MNVVALVALIIWPIIILVCIFTFRAAIVAILTSAEEGEIGPRGMKWRRYSGPNKTAIQADSSPKDSSSPAE